MTDHERRSRYVKIALSFYAIWVVVFILEGLYAQTLPVTDLTIRLDKEIPVVPGFVWIYMSCYLFPLITLLVVRDWHRFNLALLSIALCTLLAFIGHLAIPVAFPRPALGSSLSARMLAFIYDNDFKPGAQNFPSLHVAIALIIYWTCRRQGLSRLVESAILAMALLIIVSTVLVKQHLIIDLVGGLLLATGVWGFLSRVYRRSVSRGEDPLVVLAALTRRLAPLYAFCTLCVVAVGVIRGLW
jgi:membrane-associated phospholipid phosphatase